MVRLVTNNRRGDEIKAGEKLGYICVRLFMLAHTHTHTNTHFSFRLMNATV